MDLTYINPVKKEEKPQKVIIVDDPKKLEATTGKWIRNKIIDFVSDQKVRSYPYTHMVSQASCVPKMDLTQFCPILVLFLILSQVSES